MLSYVEYLGFPSKQLTALLGCTHKQVSYIYGEKYITPIYTLYIYFETGGGHFLAG